MMKSLKMEAGLGSGTQVTSVALNPLALPLPPSSPLPSLPLPPPPPPPPPTRPPSSPVWSQMGWRVLAVAAFPLDGHHSLGVNHIPKGTEGRGRGGEGWRGMDRGDSIALAE